MNFILEIKNLLRLGFIDQKNKFTGSMLGFLWAFIKPFLTLFVFVLVFSVGFKSMPVNDVPFTLWLLSGMIPWFFISDTWISTSYSLLEYQYLIKKIKYNSFKIPIIKIISNFYIHLVFIIFLVLMSTMTVGFSVHYFGVIYITIALLILIFGLSLITSSLILFLPDIKSLLDVIMQFTFWLTPIIWDGNYIDKGFEWLIKYNPFSYIINCYRTIFVYNQSVFTTDYFVSFWVITLIILFLGLTIFDKLKKHFADVV